MVIKNVTNVLKRKNFLYFQALGKVEVLVDCAFFYKYINLKIESKEFDFNLIKQKTLNDIMNNLLALHMCKNLQKYLRLLKNILKIDINNKKIAIKPNKFKISYSVLYKLNNKLKRVNINQTL